MTRKRRRWQDLIPIALLVVVYASLTSVDRAIVCGGLPSDTSLSVRECVVTFWWLGLLWPLRLLRTLQQNGLFLLVTFLLAVWGWWSLHRVTRRLSSGSAKPSNSRVIYSMLIGAAGAVAAYAVFSSVSLSLGFFSLFHLLLVLLLSGVIGAGVAFLMHRYLPRKPFWLSVAAAVFLTALFISIASIVSFRTAQTVF